MDTKRVLVSWIGHTDINVDIRYFDGNGLPFQGE